MRAPQLLGHRHLGRAGPPVAAPAGCSQRHDVQGAPLLWVCACSCEEQLPKGRTPGNEGAAMLNSVLYSVSGTLDLSYTRSPVAAPVRSDQQQYVQGMLSAVQVCVLRASSLLSSGRVSPLLTASADLNDVSARAAQLNQGRHCAAVYKSTQPCRHSALPTGAAEEGAGRRRHSALGTVPGRHREACCSSVPCSHASCLPGGLCAPDGELSATSAAARRSDRHSGVLVVGAHRKVTLGWLQCGHVLAVQHQLSCAASGQCSLLAAVQQPCNT